MDIASLLAERIAEGKMCPGSRTLEQWLGAAWIRVRVGGRDIPVIPTWGLKKALVAHDVHHLILGYPTSLRGELEIAAWELGSGGCGWNLPFWFDRIAAAAIGLVLHPIVTSRAFRAGLGVRNLYGTATAELLAVDVLALGRRLRRPA